MLWTTHTIGLMALEKAANVLLKTEPDYALLLAPLSGSSMRIEVLDWNLCCVTFVSEGHLYIRINTDHDAVVCLKGTLMQYKNLMNSMKHPGAFQGSGLTVSGDLGVLQAWERLLTQWPHGLESVVSAWLGDTPARVLCNGLGRLAAWGRACWVSTRQDVVEALQEEKNILPPTEAVTDFYEDIAQFRQSVDRLAAKLSVNGLRVNHKTV